MLGPNEIVEAKEKLGLIQPLHRFGIAITYRLDEYRCAKLPDPATEGILKTMVTRQLQTQLHGLGIQAGQPGEKKEIDNRPA